MRRFLLVISIGVVGLIFISRLFYLQIYEGGSRNLFEDNAIRKVYDYPKRGFVFDRNGELLVSNQPSYDVMFIPREVKPFDTLEFCSLLKISKQTFDNIFEKHITILLGCHLYLYPTYPKKIMLVYRKKCANLKVFIFKNVR